MTSAKIELLAPARDLQCGIAAIDCGADAIYIGAANFGAREQAGNSLDDISSLLEYAHRYWAKVYVTVNTLLHDDEFPAALALIDQLYQRGVDALIIQDCGLLECDLPPIPLFASTQMHNHTPERVAFLTAVGLQRVILARELTLTEIRAIHAACDIELEVFIHGALCVCYSGQCYLSQAIGGRSANRGQCAQPCRKAYSLYDGEGKLLQREQHLLSLRDLNLTDHLGELLDAGVTSLKIEGRLKDRAYVMNVISHYRQALDTQLAVRGWAKSSSGQSNCAFTADVNKTFNRGYSSYFLHGEGQQITAWQSPKMVGEHIGSVIAISAAGVVLESNTALHTGDGITFFNAQGRLQGSSINGITALADGQQLLRLANQQGIAVGMAIYRNHDHDFLNQLAKIQPQRTIQLDFTLHETDTGLSLTASDEDGVTAKVTIKVELVDAEKPEQAQAAIEKQLAKTGGSSFNCRTVTIALTRARFIPVSLLNSLRREALTQLAAAREAARPRLAGGISRNELPYPQQRLTFRGNIINKKAADFYRRHGVKEIELGAEAGTKLSGRVVMSMKHCLRRELGYCPKKTDAATANEPWHLQDSEGHHLPLSFDCQRCEMLLYAGKKR